MEKVIITLIINFMCLHFSFGQCSNVLMYDIQTPMGSLVETWIMCEEATVFRESNDDWRRQTYPNAQQIIVYDGLSSTKKFNCHGYAWIRVEQGIDRWINKNNINTNDFLFPDNYMTDGSYVQVPSETYPGKVFWTRAGDHSAVTTEQSGWFISKWGNGPLCKHRWDDSPYGTNFKYYRHCVSPTINFTNQTVTTNTTITGCDINVQNVIVTNNAKLILDATIETIINGPFEVQLGSELKIR